MNNPKVSVIIPVYNSEETLLRCLESVACQTYDNYNIYAIDNNSTDRSPDILNEFELAHPRLCTIREITQGRSAARNAGIRAADGEIVAMTDSDCVVPHDWIEKLIAPIIREGEDAAVGSETDLIGNFWTRNIQKANTSFIARNLRGNYVNHIDTKNFAVKACIIKDFMFNTDLKALEDFELYLRLKKNINIRFVPDVRVGHNHSASFIRFVNSSFERGYYAIRVYKMHRDKTDLSKEVMMESISLRNFCLFPPWIAVQFAKRPPGEAYFMFVSELSWRLGILWGLIKK